MFRDRHGGTIEFWRCFGTNQLPQLHENYWNLSYPDLWNTFFFILIFERFFVLICTLCFFFFAQNVQFCIEHLFSVSPFIFICTKIMQGWKHLRIFSCNDGNKTLKILIWGFVSPGVKIIFNCCVYGKEWEEGNGRLEWEEENGMRGVGSGKKKRGEAGRLRNLICSF